MLNSNFKNGNGVTDLVTDISKSPLPRICFVFQTLTAFGNGVTDFYYNLLYLYLYTHTRRDIYNSREHRERCIYSLYRFLTKVRYQMQKRAHKHLILKEVSKVTDILKVRYQVRYLYEQYIINKLKINII